MAPLCVYIDGKYVKESEAKVSVFDHGLLYGDGVFEGIRAYEGRVFRLEEHIERLWNSARAILLNIPLAKEELCEVVLELLRKNGVGDCYIRVVITRGVGDLGLDPRKCSRASVIVMADAMELYPKQLYEEGLRLITVSTRRNSPQALNPAIKSLNYLNNILGKLEANRAGAAEGVMLTQDGFVAEATADNVFIAYGGAVITPPVHLGILPGITRAAVMEMAERRELEVREIPFTLHEVYSAEECFLTGTGAEVVPVVELDGRQIGDGRPGPITRALMEDFSQLVRTEGTEIWPSREMSEVRAK
jgi:branched-chain amino acid aminotransferase